MSTNERIALEKWRNEILKERELWESVQTDFSHIKLCLLYTSDAADE